MYTLRLPFELPDGYQINDTDSTVFHNGLEFKLKNETRLYALLVKGFNTEEDAKSFLPNSWCGLMWVLLNCGLAPKFELDLQKVFYSNDPKETAKNLSKSLGVKQEEEIHGVIDGARPAIFETSGKYKSLTGGNVNLILGASIDRFYEFFFSGMSEETPEKGLNHRKLRIALELYSAFFSESTSNARFLTLVMVLETLAKPEKRPKLVLDLLTEFREKIEELENEVEEESVEAISLESLKTELTFRQEDSIRKQIRSLVFNVLSEAGNTDATEVARKAVNVYDKRSTLVHDGYLAPDELSQLTKDIREIVERVLRAKFIQVVRGKHA